MMDKSRMRICRNPFFQIFIGTVDKNKTTGSAALAFLVKGPANTGISPMRKAKKLSNKAFFSRLISFILGESG